jgi:acylphosphatase
VPTSTRPGHNRRVIRKQAIVRGEVQGVSFRFHTQATANRLGAAGFVRNLRDGSVEVEVEADERTVERMIDWLKSGPTWANVVSVDVADREPTGDRTFSILD